MGKQHEKSGSNVFKINSAMKKLLILTQYFPPEIGAPQNRLYELAVRLEKSGIDITVLTAMPNYPQMEIHENYKNLKYHFEEMNSMKVHRSSIYVSKSKKIVSRLRNYFSFVWSSYWVGKKKLEKKYDFILCESPPLFLGLSAVRLAKKKKAKLIFNVSDLWPESAEKMGIVTNKMFLKAATILEEYLYKKSILITGQTQGIVANIKGRFPSKDVYWLPNGVDLDYYKPNENKVTTWRVEHGFSPEDVIFFYGGIIGHAQGLEVILNAAKLIQKENVKFILMGSGPEKDNLIAMAAKYNLSNVKFMEPVSKLDMPNILDNIDVALIPLRKLDLFKGAIPSKIFESLAKEIPVLLGVDGEAKELFIDKGECGIYFEPENEIELKDGIIKLAESKELRLKFGKNGRQYAFSEFNRNNIANNFNQKLLEL
jgi:glycosyltransferase involved in cell wall biosynthesis